jgi:uncharacterized cupredoxin-like copper-binding protein
MKRHCFSAVGIAVAATVGLIVPAAAAAARTETTVNVTAGKPSELRFTLSKRTFPHGTVAFRLTNAGALAHDLKICASPKGGSANSCAGKVTRLIGPGQSVTLTYTFKTGGTYEYLCTVPGHAAAGMKGDVKVT